MKNLDVRCIALARVYVDREESLKAAGVGEMGDGFSTPAKNQNNEKLKTARLKADVSREARAAKRRCMVSQALAPADFQPLGTPKKPAQASSAADALVEVGGQD